ncbi:helix-turn-helix transcriptional regulator [Prescottella equi]|uniref:helix-turn-helix transcriptional regulator n=1 Tax=Rhodococcus hoagii TaxID=43767 RepID=UPI000A1099CB|nr:AraC family transcriptional regulator [Prescottella equi]MBM4693677.1 helix-turn-helix domain-containing protein [Prescottella equi]NKS34079.1 helix-turn-helix domain-containing protein [Prescottella equi]NKS38947.1 helix-turn-helix domain-containing protein [Prescottella equi]ORJ99283.1 AraC family transcriptional regulator [Prescottella equi]ORL98536.1 AraC family transcriptional regulator [Prescottella equi]
MAAEPASSGPSAWGGMLTLTPGAVLYRGPGGNADLHAHHAVQVLITLDEPFVLEFADSSLEASAAVVPSGLPHRLRCTSRDALLMLVEPLGPRGRGLGAVGSRSRGQEHAHTLARIATERVREPSATATIDHLLGAITSEGPPRSRALSRPVRSAVQHLERNAGTRPTLTGAAAEAHLSPSRLTHLFTQEVGIPFRRYGLWVRLRAVAEHVAAGSDLTRAAVAAGFSDSAHLSRVFKRNFGLTPSALLGMTVDRDAWPTGGPTGADPA